MSRSYLKSEDKSEFQKSFYKLDRSDFESAAKLEAAVRSNSQWLEHKILSRWNSWEELHPILLGSWSRHELCPASDLDILFVGPEEKVLAFIQEVQEKGFRLRYRVPEDPQDWTVGVEPFDVLALFNAEALTDEGRAQLEEQKKRLVTRQKTLRKSILREVIAERKKRQKRLDSITNFLEPNLKYTPGGLRDIEQGLALFRLFEEKFPDAEHALQVLNYYKYFILLARQKNQIQSSQDILAGPEQLDLAKSFGFSSLSEYMKEMQRGFSRSYFYSEWILEVCRTPALQLEKIQKRNFSKAEDLYKALHQDTGILTQKKVRDNLDRFYPRNSKEKLSPIQVKGLEALLGPKTTDEAIVAHFSSRLIDKILPPVEKLVGHVQHDQYHRFTADIHLQQACREYLRVRKSAKELGALKDLHKEMTAKDWKLVGWNCLFHDLSKGQGGDHSHEGAQNVRKLLPKDLGEEFLKELEWLVENHLLLSSLAFRKSPFSSLTLQELEKQNVTPERLRRLAIFTAVDIRATNPEAWNQWKGQLIRDFLKDLISREGKGRRDLLAKASKYKSTFPVEWIDNLDAFLVERLPAKTLLDDIVKIRADGKSSIKIFRIQGRTWVRFFEPSDRPGLLIEFVDRLHQAGGGILHASVQSLPGLGVYDWFQVRLSKTREKLIFQKPGSISLPTNIKFEAIDVSAAGDSEWLVSFRAKDQKGLLKTASYLLSELGANIKSARVHTWGLRVEDVFIISYSGSQEELKEKITSSFASYL